MRLPSLGDLGLLRPDTNYRSHQVPPWPTVNPRTPSEADLRIRNDSFAVPSFSSSSTDEDDRYLLTPNPSRTNSIGGSSPGAGHIPRPASAAQSDSGRRSSDQRKTWCKLCHAHNCKDHPTPKGIKEKERRKVSQVYLQEVESLLEQLVGYTAKKSQSTGNGNSAGLYTDKDELMRITLGLLSSILHDGYVKAIQNGTLAAWQSEYKNRLVKSRQATSILDGTYLFDYERDASNDPCDKKDTKSRECTTHNHRDWRECRVSRLSRNHDINMAKAHRDQANYVRNTTAASRSEIID